MKHEKPTHQEGDGMSKAQNWIMSFLLAVAGWVFIDIAAHTGNLIAQSAIYMLAMGCFIAVWEVIRSQDK